MTYRSIKNGQTFYDQVTECNDSEYQEALTSYLVPATGHSDIGVFAGNTLHGRSGGLLLRKLRLRLRVRLILLRQIALLRSCLRVRSRLRSLLSQRL